METILQEIKNACQFNDTPQFIRHLHGGDINEVYLIEADDEKWVVKQNDATRFPIMLEKEFRAMQFLQGKSPLYYPKMKNHFTNSKQQFLIMEYVEESENSTTGQQKLGQVLAQQHKVSNDRFGWEEDNYIGSLKQMNSYKDNWEDFYAENRLLYQTKMAFD